MKGSVKKMWILVGLTIFFFICAAIPYLYAMIDRTPSIPRQEKESVGEISKSIGFSIVYPDIDQLH